MSKRYVKILLFIGTILFLTGALFLFFYHPPKLLEVDFLAVGQGDAMLIKSPYGQKILIDAGPDRKILEALGGVMPWFDRKIDLAILSHPHADHVGGLSDVLKRYAVGRFLASSATSSDPLYEEWASLRKAKKIPLLLAAEKQKIILGPDCYLEIFAPQKITKDYNNDSLVARLVYQNNEFLFVGDAEKKEEDELLGRKIDLRADVLKVGHHGSDTATGEEFLKAVDPRLAIIEAGAGNQFGLPKKEILDRLKNYGVKIFRTDDGRTIKFKSDGQTILNIR